MGTFLCFIAKSQNPTSHKFLMWYIANPITQDRPSRTSSSSDGSFYILIIVDRFTRWSKSYQNFFKFYIFSQEFFMGKSSLIFFLNCFNLNHLRISLNTQTYINPTPHRAYSFTYNTLSPYQPCSKQNAFICVWVCHFQITLRVDLLFILDFSSKYDQFFEMIVFSLKYPGL